MADLSADPSKLMVIVPGLRKTKVQSLVDKIQATHPDYRVKLLPHKLHPFSLRRTLNQAVSELAREIRGLSGENVGKAKHTTEVVLVGHSLGGILIRAAYLYGLGYDRETADDSEPHDWAKKVTRIVLLGSPNTGFREQNLPGGWAYPFLAGLGSFALESVHAGAFWIANLRLRWLEVMRKLWAEHSANPRIAFTPPLIVQVYGLKDDVVAREDIDDSKFMPHTVSSEVSTGNHGELVDLTDPATKKSRWPELEHAIFGQHANADVFSAASSDPVYFILHGIRASAYDDWIRDLRETLQPGQKEIALAERRPKVVEPNYGFFSAFQFAIRGTRRSNIHQFLDLYLAEVLTHQSDGFSFIGHSNGTYMMANVMKNVRAVRFRRIMLAGSVLPPTFDWARLFDLQQIGYYDDDVWHHGQVHNDRARKDYPVGFLANGMRGLFFRDVGAAGFRGFEGVQALNVTYHEHTYPKGHGAALMNHTKYPPRMPEIANYLVNGVTCPEPLDNISKPFAWLSRMAPYLMFVLAAALLYFLVVGFIALLGTIGLGWAIGIYVAALGLTYMGLRTF
ncbi:esterase/lipase family protein [Pseudarthrobacter albicanus]|uniref:esterase/lipase family protein n=1 Tax=Pseudarthrobacter albicanus TaxID=2823873 RepID=UPI001BA5CB1C|nr:hypothetical protein [Pseudarthrobacter albicanus]